jgi:hypothetical protein
MTLVVVCSLLVVVSARAQDGRATCPATVELNGTAGSPLGGQYSDARVMSVYLASEFACDGGTIVGLSFEMVGTYTMNNLTIRPQRVTASPRRS